MMVWSKSGGFDQRLDEEVIGCSVLNIGYLYWSTKLHIGYWTKYHDMTLNTG